MEWHAPFLFSAFFVTLIFVDMILSSVLLANALVNGVSKTITNVSKAAVGNACCAADVNIGIPAVIAACAG